MDQITDMVGYNLSSASTSFLRSWTDGLRAQRQQKLISLQASTSNIQNSKNESSIIQGSVKVSPYVYLNSNSGYDQEIMIEESIDKRDKDYVKEI